MSRIGMGGGGGGGGGGGASAVWAPIFGAAAAFTNLAAAETQLNYAIMVDWTDATEFRIQLATDSVGGSVGTVIRTKWAAPPTFTAASFADLTNGDLSMEGTFTFRDTGWQPIDAGARTGPVMLRLFTEGGDGVVDPRIFSYAIQWR